jgi:2-oxoglutarate dehydrogenase E1 component
MQQVPNTDSVAFIEALFAEYAQNPAGVPPEWQHVFDEWKAEAGGLPKRFNGPSFRPSSIFNPGGPGASGAVIREVIRVDSHQDRVDQLVRAYRVRGHLVARLDPLGRHLPFRPELKPKFYGFTKEDLGRPFSSRTIQGANVRTLREIIRLLRTTYCRAIGVQFMHIDDLKVRHWLQDRMEGSGNRLNISRDMQLRILTRLTDAVIFEEFIQKRYVGAKRFSLEGSESLIPLLDLAIEKTGEHGVTDIVLGMAHRGRLNVLANIIGKSPQHIFREFDDVDPGLHTGRGDVKYHLGYSSDWTTHAGHKVHLSLCFNPSHLEYVDGVALGRTRAKQDRLGDREGHKVLCLLIHGDAAFAGQGVVQETLNLSELPGYRTGGTLHVVVNNQIGFTTTNREARSSLYPTALAKMLQSPIFHVNGENPEAVAQAILLAMDFRKEFHRDVVIDMWCYRRHGHNESDEPSFTQPIQAKKIERRCSVRDGYLHHLLALGEVTEEEADRIAAERRAQLEKELSVARSDDYVYKMQTAGGIWRGYRGGPAAQADVADTRVDHERLADLLVRQSVVPDGFEPHPKITRLLAQRREMAEGKRPLDWAAAEALALASLAAEGYRIRLSGQDSARGTFSHRHGILYNYRTGEPYVPLRHLAPDQGSVDLINSPLSEAGVLGFDYGYSLDCPDGLVIWEAQFGDFCNSAQVIVDQFIASAEEKWRRLSGVVLLLPHGFEGQGPEHSSARLERFLTLAAEDNIQIAQPSTPAQFFHLLRRQVLRKWRKPLVVLTPKSLLRHPDVVSSLDELAGGAFHPILPDSEADPAATKRILLCSGRVYYDLRKRREEQNRKDVAILRVEQLYPLSIADMGNAVAPYADGVPAVWVQDEPENMGAWRTFYVTFGPRLVGRFPLSRASRRASASPATGSPAAHKQEQQKLLDEAFAE